MTDATKLCDIMVDAALASADARDQGATQAELDALWERYGQLIREHANPHPINLAVAAPPAWLAALRRWGRWLLRS